MRPKFSQMFEISRIRAKKKKKTFYLNFSSFSWKVKMRKNQKNTTKSYDNFKNYGNFLQFLYVIQNSVQILYKFCTLFAKGLKILTRTEKSIHLATLHKIIVFFTRVFVLIYTQKYIRPITHVIEQHCVV